MSITKSQARAEIARRQAPKGERPLPANLEAFQMSGKALAAIAGDAPKVAQPTTAPKVAAKVGRSKGSNPHTLLRQAASEVKRAFWHATGENLTYEQACAHFGTAPAKAGQDESTKVTKTMTAKARLALKDPAAFVTEVLV